MEDDVAVGRRAVKSFGIVLAGLLLGTGAMADELVLPPALPPGTSLISPPNLGRAPVRHLFLGRYWIILERTRLAEIRDVIGRGVIRHRGDAGEYIAWLCYTAKTQRLWITSSELGGPDHLVDGVSAAIGEGPALPSKECPELPKKFQPMTLDNAVWLGLPFDTLARRVGPPAKIAADLYDYEFQGVEAKPEKSFDEGVGQSTQFDVVSSLVIQIAKGRVTRLWASKGTTY